MDTENETSSVKFDGKGSKHDAFGILVTVKYSMYTLQWKKDNEML